MNEQVIWAGGHGVVLSIVLAGIAFVSGLWGILIALAPAAYFLVLFPHNSDNTPKTVVITHLTALIAGWVAYTALAQGIAPTSIEPMSESGLRIVGSIFLAFVASTVIFYILQTEHPMAYVTAFTAAIGAFPTTRALLVGGGAVLSIAGLQVLRRKVGPEPTSEATAPDSSLPSTTNQRQY